MNALTMNGLNNNSKKTQSCWKNKKLYAAYKRHNLK